MIKIPSTTPATRPLPPVDPTKKKVKVAPAPAPINAKAALAASRRAAGLPPGQPTPPQPMGVTDEFVKRYVDGRVVPAEFRHW